VTRNARAQPRLADLTLHALREFVFSRSLALTTAEGTMYISLSALYT